MKLLPLANVKVLDLSRVLAGPLCSMMLADMGANVIKVERPISGDDTRGWGPPFAEDGQSAYFRSVNRNKLSLAADLALGQDQELVKNLALQADVILENYLPGALDRKNIRSTEILANNPKAVWCTISGFGPESSRPGYDFIVQAEAGWMSISGPEDGEPYKIGVALADVIAGKDAAAAILAALIGRHNMSVEDRRLNISLMKSATAALVNVAQNTLVSGNVPQRWGNAHPNLVPYQLFQASDRPFVVAIGNDSQWEACSMALQLPAEPRWTKNEGRVKDRANLVSAIQQVFTTGSADHWIRLLSDRGVPCGVVRSVPEALSVVKGHDRFGIEPATGGNMRLYPPNLDEHGQLVRSQGWNAFKVIS